MRGPPRNPGTNRAMLSHPLRKPLRGQWRTTPAWLLRGSRRDHMTNIPHAPPDFNEPCSCSGRRGSHWHDDRRHRRHLERGSSETPGVTRARDDWLSPIDANIPSSASAEVLDGGSGAPAGHCLAELRRDRPRHGRSDAVRAIRNW